jgi:hypothetical protein
LGESKPNFQRICLVFSWQLGTTSSMSFFD